jgi:hypothetical protein
MQQRGKHRVTVGNGVMQLVARKLQQLQYNNGDGSGLRRGVILKIGAIQLVENQVVKRRLGGWCEMAVSLGAS